jgi:hypothetical protein
MNQRLTGPSVHPTPYRRTRERSVGYFWQYSGVHGEASAGENGDWDIYELLKPLE